MQSDVSTWLLLVFTPPGGAAGKRAALVRALKNLGAVWLRDGVAALPERPDCERALAALVATCVSPATIVRSARLEPDRARELVEEARAQRAAEYASATRQVEQLTWYVSGVSAQRPLRPAERRGAVTSLRQLTRQVAAIRGRDHFGADGAPQAESALASCAAALAGQQAGWGGSAAASP